MRPALPFPRGLDRTLPVPLYHQLAEILRRQIEEGPWQPGDFFTTEEALQKAYGVSRATVRRTLQQLMDDGLLERITGKGTFIARPSLRISLPHLVSFSEEIEAQGKRPGTRVLEVRLVAAAGDVAAQLHVPAGTAVLRVRRIRYADDEPWIYMTDYLHPHLGLTEADDFGRSLYDLLTERAGVTVEAAVHRIGATLLTPDVAEALQAAAGSPGLLFHRTSYDAAEAPLVYEEAVCRGDRYTYSMRLTRRGGLRHAVRR